MDINSKDENLEVFADFAKDIKLVVMDVDGVLTDGKIYQGIGETQIKAFHSKDGMGIRLLQKYKMAINFQRNFFYFFNISNNYRN